MIKRHEANMNSQYYFGQSWPETSSFNDDFNFSLAPTEAGPTRSMDIPRSAMAINNYRQTRHSLGSMTVPLVDNELLGPSWQASAIYNRDVHEDPWDPHRAGRSTALDRTVPRHTEVFHDSGIGSASGFDKHSVVSAPPGGEYVLALPRTKRPGYQRPLPRAQISRGPLDTLSATSELRPCVLCYHERGINRFPKNHADQK